MTRDAGIFFLRHRRTCEAQNEPFKILEDLSDINRDELFILIPDRGNRRHGLSKKHNHTRIRMRVTISDRRLVSFWSRLPGRFVNSNNVKGSKIALDVFWVAYIQSWNSKFRVRTQNICWS